MSIYHSENQSNQYNSKEEYRDEKKNGWNYTYLITVDHRVPDDPRKYYIGVRTSDNDNLPEEDPYLGSSKPLRAFLVEHPEAKVTKTILAYFLTRDDADDNEIELHAEFKVASNPEYFNLASRISIGFSTYGTSPSEEVRQKISDWYDDPANADAIAKSSKKHSDWYKDPKNADAIAKSSKKLSDWWDDPANADAIAKKKQKHRDWYDDPDNANAIAERYKKISESIKDYFANPHNADSIAERNKKISEKAKAYRANPDNADAIAKRGKEHSDTMKNKPKFVCRVSDRKEYRACDIAQWGLEKLGLI